MGGRDHRMARVVIRAGGGDSDRLADGAGCSRQSDRFLLVVALGDERGAEPHGFAGLHLFDQVARALGLVPEPSLRC